MPKLFDWLVGLVRRASRGKVAYRSGDLYIVTFGEKDGQTWGRLLNIKSDAPPGPLVPVGSIAAHCPYEDFKKFTGDAQPILEEMQRRLNWAQGRGEGPAPPVA